MANTLQIKRRTATAVAPGSLAAGEMAYNDHADGKLLYIGIAGPGVEVIAGKGQYSAAQTVLVSKASKASPEAVALAASQFVGRGSTGDIGAMALGSDKGLAFNGTNLEVALATNSGLEFATGLKINLDGNLLLGAGGLSVDTSTIATRAYVDGAIQGLDIHPSVRAASAAAGTLATDFENGDSFGGVTLVTGNRILLKDQASAIENGIYTVNVSGAPTRAVDLTTAHVAAGSFVFVEEGTHADTGWVCTANALSDVVGTNNLPWSQFSGSGSYTASLGVEKVGNDFRIDFATDPGLELSGNELRVKAGTGITVNSSGVNIGQAVGTASSVTFGNITDSGLTAGRVTYASTAGLLVDEAGFEYNAGTNTLSVPVLDGATIDGGSY